MRCSLVFVGCVWATILEDLYGIRSQINMAIGKRSYLDLHCLRDKILRQINGLGPEEKQRVVAGYIGKEEVSKCIEHYVSGLDDLQGILKLADINIDDYIDPNVVDREICNLDADGVESLFYQLVWCDVSMGKLISRE